MQFFFFFRHITNRTGFSIEDMLSGFNYFYQAEAEAATLVLTKYKDPSKDRTV